MKEFTVLTTNPIHPRGVALLEEAADVVVAPDTATSTLAELAREADAIIVRTQMSPEVIRAATRVRAVVRHGIGLDYIPVEEASAQGIIVANVPGANSLSVVEHVIGVILLLARQFDVLNLARNGANWDMRSQVQGVELYGKTLGVLGMGRIGSRVAMGCRAAFDMNVLAHDPMVSEFPEGCQDSDIEAVFSEADFVTLHVPLTRETTGIVDRTLLLRMKRSAFLINAARGPIIREADLIEVLSNERIAGVALDVFQEEPPPADHPLMNFDRVVLTPHSAALTEESMIRMSEESAREVLRILKGEKPVNLVNPDVWSHRRQ